LSGTECSAPLPDQCTPGSELECHC
jgi:hypothetical protein